MDVVDAVHVEAYERRLTVSRTVTEILAEYFAIELQATPFDVNSVPRWAKDEQALGRASSS